MIHNIIFLITVGVAFIDDTTATTVNNGFEEFIVDAKETCDNKFKIGESTLNEGEDACRERCRSDPDCNYYFYTFKETCDNKEWCVLYKDCSEKRFPHCNGRTFRKTEATTPKPTTTTDKPIIESPSDRTCSKGQCWCVTNGGNTCQRWDILYYGNFLSNAKCDIDKCVSVADCQFNGYWCDDSQDPGGENQDLDLVDCSKYWKSDMLALWINCGSQRTKCVNAKLKTYVNCMQAQMLKMQKQIVKLTTGCVDELPTDYDKNRCDWKCTNWAGKGDGNTKNYCEDKWSQHQHCAPNTNGLIKDYCKFSCTNCGTIKKSVIS